MLGISVYMKISYGIAPEVASKAGIIFVNNFLVVYDGSFKIRLAF